MAAGLTIREADYAEFSELFDTQVRNLTGGRLPGAELVTDGSLAPDDINLELAGEIESAGPWGQGFPEPLFDGVFSVADARLVGDKHLKLKLRFEGRKQPVDAISFNTDLDAVDPDAEDLRLVYQLAVNDYNGYQTLQLIIRHIQPSE